MLVRGLTYKIQQNSDDDGPDNTPALQLSQIAELTLESPDIHIFQHMAPGRINRAH